MREYLRADLQELDDHEWNGVSGLTVIKAVADADGQVGDVAGRIDDRTEVKKATAIPTAGRAQFLSGGQVGDWNKRETLPVLPVDKSGEIPGWSVELTDYGRVLKPSAAWPLMRIFPLTGVPEELVEAALDELND